MRSFLNKLYHVELVIGGLAVAGIVGVNIVNVIMRYLPNISPIVGAEDITQLLFCWMIFIGASVAYGEGMHYGMDLVIDRMSGKLKMIWLLAIKVIILLASIFLAIESYILMINVSAKVTGTLRIPYWLIDMAPLVGFSFMTIHGIDLIVTGIRELQEELHAEHNEANRTKGKETEENA